MLPLADAIVVRAADIYALLYQRGQLISDVDILIAATAALDHNLTMVTESREHFRAFPA